MCTQQIRYIKLPSQFRFPPCSRIPKNPSAFARNITVNGQDECVTAAHASEINAVNYHHKLHPRISRGKVQICVNRSCGQKSTCLLPPVDKSLITK